MAEELTNKPSRQAERFGKYEIVAHIATGGMGVVYKARDIDLDRLVALKVLPPDLAKNQTTLIRFKREAAAAAQLRHENIVQIFDIGEARGTYYIAFEFVEGTDLQDYINRQCKLDVRDARQIMIQAARALAHAHDQHVVHRDIKPSNFLLTYKDRRLVIKLSDFGLAIRQEDDAEFRLTKDRSTVGTVDYMSPEQATDSRSVDIRSDIYSLGCTFYHMLAGQAPFSKGSLPERILQHMQNAPPDLRTFNKQVPPAFAAIINRMLEKNPADRYQTPTELLRDLEQPDRRGKAKPREGKLERHAPETNDGGTGEFDSVRPGADKTPPSADRARPSVEKSRPKAEKPRPKVEIDELDMEVVTPRVELAPSRIELAPSRAADDEPGIGFDQAGDESVELVPLKVSEPQPKPMRRSDPALKVKVKMPVPEAAATETPPETDEVETSKADKIKKKTRAGNSPWWMYAVGGSAALLGVILIFAIITGTRPPPTPKKKDAPAVVVAPQPVESTTIRNTDTSGDRMGAPAPEFALLDPAFAKVDRGELRKEYAGLFGAFPGVPENAKTLRVSRLAPTAPGSCRSLAEALAQAQPDQWTLIEIADNGPIYVSALPHLPRRLIVLRGAQGFHPLVAWDTPKKSTDATTRTLLSIPQGSLILDNLDIVLKAADDAPFTLFELGTADFFCRNCSFSLVGSPQRDITLLRRQGALDNASQKRTSQTWLKRCFVRGPDVTLLNLREASTNLLVEESLIVGQQQPLIQVRGGDDDALGFHCVRSTMVASQLLLRWQAAEGKIASPRIQGRILDSILSRDDAKAPLGDMVYLGEDAGLKNMSWRATNSVYAGWKRLLTSSQKSIATNELDLWQALWDYKGPDRALADPWPSGPPSALETQPASTFLPSGPVVFEAAAGSGALGAVIGWLPGEPAVGVERVYEPRPAPAMPPAGFALPVIEDINDGLYHGEDLNLNRVDLGKHLQDKLQRMNPAARVVMYLSGTGLCQTSSLRVKGIEHLVLYFVPTKDPTKALTLELNPAAIAQRSPIIEMSEGHLDLIGARVHVSPITLVPHVLSLQDASLTLTRCRLTGPLVKSNDSFKSLIALSGGDEAPTTLLVRDSLLVSSKTLIQLRDNVQLKAKNSVFLSFADAVQIDADGPIRSMTHLLDHNTFAVRHAVFNLRQGKDYEPAGSVGLFAFSNVFLRPFAEEFDKGALLRGAESWTAQGHWHWQGRNNVYDSRQFAFYAGAGKLAADRQTLRDWQAAWGHFAEQDALSYDGAPATKLITLDTALQFDRLALPKDLRGDPAEPPPGADLVGLGLVKKKG